MASKQVRVFAVVRQSRGNDGSLSLEEQEAKVRAWAKAEGYRIVKVAIEQDVSGQRPLAKRPGLSEAVAYIEAGRADVAAFAYFDRMVRSTKTQTEVVERVETAKGKVFALDVGAVSHATAAQWLTSSFLGLVSEYHARATGERVASAIAVAIQQGKVPFPNIPPGLRKRPDRTLEPDPTLAPVMREAFEMRARREPWRVIRLHLREHGIDVGMSTLMKLLRSKLYIGELHFGNFPPNLNACDAIVSRQLYDRVQAVRAPRGRIGKTTLLLSRQDVLYCHTCSARMTAGHVFGSMRQRVEVYRCQNEDCVKRPVISAHIVDEVVLDATEAQLAGVHGHASMHASVDAAREAAEQAHEALKGAVRAFNGLGDVEAVGEQLRALRAASDAKQAEYEELRDTVMPLETFRAEDLRDAEVIDQRRAIKIALDRVTVKPGRLSPAERIAVYPRGVEASSEALAS